MGGEHGKTTDPPRGAAAILGAVAAGQVARIADLLASGADPSATTAEGVTPLHLLPLAGARAAVGIAEALIAAGADLEARDHLGRTPLLAAVIEGRAEEVALLLEAGADPDAQLPADTLPGAFAGLTALMAAGADADKVRLLLDAGADPQRPSLDGEAPVTYFRRHAARALAEHAEAERDGDADDFARVYARGLQAALNLVTGALARP